MLSKITLTVTMFLMAACDVGGLTVADTGNCGEAIALPSPSKTCAVGVPAGLSCADLVWYLNGEAQPGAAYDVICGAGLFVVRDADACAAAQQGAVSEIRVCTH